MLDSAGKSNEPVFVLRGNDRNSVPTLKRYLRACEEDGSPTDHMFDIVRIIDEFIKYQKENPDKVKIPD